MICDLSEKICEARCCAAAHADAYVKKASKGRVTEQDFYELLLLDQYLDALGRYEKSVHLGQGCGCSSGNGSCLSEDEAKSILNQIATICGGCSCNCQ